MINSVELLKAKVEKANYLLKKKKIGATIYIRKDAFFLRAYLPAKVNPDWKKTTQQWIPIGLKAENRNLNKAKELAEELGAERATQLFTWDPWLLKEEYQPPTKKKKSFLMKDLLPEFDKDYWKIITTTRINGQLVNALVYFYSNKSISKEDFNKDLQVLKTIARNIANTLIEKNILLLTLNVDNFEYLDTDYEYTFNLHEKCIRNPNVYYLKSDQNLSKYTFSECNLDVMDTKLIEYVSEL